MEYLMTYGWAILIIAVVLAALFELGVFNTNNLGPRAQPGTCQVFRPGGPGMTANLNLEGVCNGELPEYVSSLNGQTAYVNGSGVFAYPLSNFEWIYPINFGQSNFQIISEFDGNLGSPCSGQYPNCGDIQFALSTAGDLIVWNNQTGFITSTLQVPLDKWSFVGFYTYNGATTIYLDGGSQTFSSSMLVPSSSATNWFIFGWENCCGNRYFNGSVANIQLYNTSFSSSDANVLYREGIGGVPIDLQNLVGWWPLNGNAQDYSGNNYNSKINGGATFTSQWESGYTVP